MSEHLSIARLDKALRRLAAGLAKEGLEMELALCFGRVFVTLHYAPSALDPADAASIRAWDLVQQVGDEGGLTNQWLTEDGKFYLAFFAARNRTDYDLFSPGIIVSLNEPRHLLALKIREVVESGPPEASEDLKFLNQQMGLHTPAAVSAVYQSFFPGSELPEHVAALIPTLGGREESR